MTSCVGAGNFTVVPQLAAGTAYWGPRKIGDFVGFIPSSLFPSLRSQATRGETPNNPLLPSAPGQSRYGQRGQYGPGGPIQ